jgi:hypothetical protein
MRNDIADSMGIRPRFIHSILGPSHLARSDHLHRPRDLLRIFDAADLLLDFSTDRHR